jgi:hypothetical protein
MMLAIIVYAGFTGLSALSQNKWDFMAYRFLTGLGVGGRIRGGCDTGCRNHAGSSSGARLGNFASTVGDRKHHWFSHRIFCSPRIRLASHVLRRRFAVATRRLPSSIGLKEPEAWLQARDAMRRGEKKQLGAIGDLFENHRWRRNTFVGLTLAISGVGRLVGYRILVARIDPRSAVEFAEGHP